MRIELPRRRPVLAMAIFLFWVTMPAFCQSLFDDFNSAGQYSGNFNPWNDSGGSNAGNYGFTECAACGVNGSGAVSVFQSTDTTAIYNGGGLDFFSGGWRIAGSLR